MQSTYPTTCFTSTLTRCQHTVPLVPPHPTKKSPLHSLLGSLLLGIRSPTLVSVVAVTPRFAPPRTQSSLLIRPSLPSSVHQASAVRLIERAPCALSSTLCMVKPVRPRHLSSLHSSMLLTPSPSYRLPLRSKHLLVFPSPKDNRAKMDAFSSSPLTESFPCGRFDSPAISPAASPTRTEVDFPADVDQSFNSSMSFSVTDSPPAPSPSMHLGKPSTHLLLHSPTPLLRAPRRADMMSLSYSALGSVREGETLGARPRPLGPSRTFGRELSLNTSRLSGPSSQMMTMKGKSKLLPPAVVPEARRPVSPVRLHHATSHEDMSSPKLLLPRMGRREVR